MATFNVNNFVTDKVLRFNMESHTDGSIMWSLTQVSDPSLNFTSETDEITDAIGNPVAQLDRAKSAEFTGSNAFFDLSLYAAQHGVEKQVATEDAPIEETPCFETLTVPSDGSLSVTLAHKPTAIPTAIYYLNGDDTLSTKVAYSATAGEGVFTYDEDTYTITFPSDAVAGDEYFIQYEYEATSGVAVTVTANDFPVAGKGVMEVLGYDICDQSKQIHAYWVFANAKLDSNVDISMSRDDQAHPFTIKCMTQYCDRKKLMVKLVIPDEE